MSEFVPVIGLEIHAQLLTKSKLFCGCSTEFGSEPNTHTCPVCLGLPGALPVVNEKAVEYAVMMILAVDGEVVRESVFSRKNYFYPDLPKGYQISQYDLPIGRGGAVQLSIDNKERAIPLTRIHLEEDAGKSIHDFDSGHTLIDLNRCGIPLIEIVSEPEIESPDEAHEFMVSLRRILQYIGICSGDMEKGALRCDANVSIRKRDSDKMGVKVELKNLNSFRFVKKALEYEIARQIELVSGGGKVVNETRLYDEARKVTVPMRSKEEAHDYRYFPEPDLLPLVISENLLKRVCESLPELPDVKLGRFLSEYELTNDDAGILTDNRYLADYFEATVRHSGNPSRTANWILTEVLAVLSERGISITDFNVEPRALGELVCEIEDETISGRIAKTVFAEMMETGDSPHSIIERKDLRQVSDPQALEKIIADVVDREAENVKLYRSGKTRLFSHFVGLIMRETKGRANPRVTNEILRKYLDGS